MKFLKYALGIILLLAAAFFLIGLIKPSVAYECEITVDKPLAESWAVCQDEAKMGDWLEGFQKIERISGTPGTVGAVSDVHFIHNGQEMVIRETITKLGPGETISMIFESDFMDMDYTLHMEDADGKTKVHSQTVTKGNGIVAKSTMALMSGSIKKQEKTNLANLQATIENNTTDYFPVEAGSEGPPEPITEEL